MIMTQYQVAYQGQILTDPTDLKTASHVAACENGDALLQGHEPLAEVVLAKQNRAALMRFTFDDLKRAREL